MQVKFLRPVLFLFLIIFNIGFSTQAHALIAGGCGTLCMARKMTPSCDIANDVERADCNRQGAVQYYGLKKESHPDAANALVKPSLILMIFIFYLTSFCCGKLVEQKNISISISRKVVCLATFTVAAIQLFSTQNNKLFAGSILSSLIAFIFILLPLTSFIRKRFSVADTMFTSINRPEDEPYTLAWMASEMIATLLLIIIVSPLLFEAGYRLHMDVQLIQSLLLIPIFASGVGDALAEIVGKKWGKHHYTTKSLFGGRLYTRSLEGSAMVFLTTLATGLVVAALQHFQMPLVFWKAFVALPFTLTLAEAKAPHTWDNPILYLVGYSTIFTCLL